MVNKKCVDESRLLRVLRSYRFAEVAFLFTLLGLAGCATTEDLYAVYDDQLCPVQLAEALPGKTVVQDRLTLESMEWEAAVYFDFDSAELGQQQITHLDKNLKVLAAYPKLNLALRGFTDERGTEVYNKGLADRRNDSVEKYLIENGVNDNRLHMVSFGEALSLSSAAKTRLDSDRRQGRNMNKNRSPKKQIQEKLIQDPLILDRRVELLLLDRNGRPVEMGLYRQKNADAVSGISAQ